MKTKIVYCFITDNKSLLYNQLLVSLYTLKLNNQDAFVEVVTDNSSRQYLDEDISQFIDSIIECDIPEKFNTPKLKSRYIKTSLRNIIDGDYLFIDADTFIVDDLSELDSIANNISAVYNGHHTNIFNKDNVKRCSNWINKFGELHNIDFNGGEHFNSGIMLVKDNELTRNFYKKWHENWIKYYSNKIHQDEPTLVMTNMEFGNIIKPLSPVYNCQLPLGDSEDFLDTAKIHHYINNCMRPNFLSKDLDYIKEHYDDIKTWFATYWKRNRRNKRKNDWFFKEPVIFIIKYEIYKNIII